jgi:hypothetical protein
MSVEGGTTLTEEVSRERKSVVQARINFFDQIQKKEPVSTPGRFTNSRTPSPNLDSTQGDPKTNGNPQTQNNNAIIKPPVPPRKRTEFIGNIPHNENDLPIKFAPPAARYPTQTNIGINHVNIFVVIIIHQNCR